MTCSPSWALPGSSPARRRTVSKLRGFVVSCRKVWCARQSVSRGRSSCGEREQPSIFRSASVSSKWVPEAPTGSVGEIIPAPQMMSWIEIENQALPDIFAAGEPVIASEKIHGSATCVTWVNATTELFVSSKGFAARKLALVESEANLCWRAVRSFASTRCCARSQCKRHRTVALYGEVYGAGVQDLHYGETRKGHTRVCRLRHRDR